MDNKKKLYRCIVEFEDEQLRRGLKPSTIFIRAINTDYAIEGARQTFNAECIKRSLQGARYHIEVFPSSDKEVQDYRRSMEHRVN